MIDYGINDDFIKSIGDTLKPETSALFLLIRKSQPEKVLAELSGFKGRVIRSSLSPEQEAKLQAALESAHPPSPSEGVEAAGAVSDTAEDLMIDPLGTAASTVAPSRTARAHRLRR